MDVVEWLKSFVKNSTPKIKVPGEDQLMQHWPRISVMLAADKPYKERGFRAPLIARTYYVHGSIQDPLSTVHILEQGIEPNPKDTAHAINNVFYSLPLPKGWLIPTKHRGTYAHCFMIVGRTTDTHYMAARADAEKLVNVPYKHAQQIGTTMRGQTKVVVHEDANLRDFETRRLLEYHFGNKLRKQGIDLGRG